MQLLCPMPCARSCLLSPNTLFQMAFLPPPLWLLLLLSPCSAHASLDIAALENLLFTCGSHNLVTLLQSFGWVPTSSWGSVSYPMNSPSPPSQTYLPHNTNFLYFVLFYFISLAINILMLYTLWFSVTGVWAITREYAPCPDSTWTHSRQIIFGWGTNFINSTLYVYPLKYADPANQPNST